MSSTNPDLLLPHWLRRSAENYPHKLALKTREGSWSFAELLEQANQLARQLASAGIRQHDRVALLAYNSRNFVLVVHALTRLGAILVPLNLRLTLPELCWQIGDAEAIWLLYDDAHVGTASEIRKQISTLRGLSLAQPESDDKQIFVKTLPQSDLHLQDEIDLQEVQSIIYTSGTTGQPKGALITYQMLWWSAIGSVLTLGHRQEDRWLACMPFFHIGGLSILMRSVINGIGVILVERFDPLVVNKAIREDQVTIISVVTVMLQRMLASLDVEGSMDHYPSHLRCVLLGGGPAPQPLLEECARREIPVVQTYGLTESCSQAVTLPPEDALRKLGSAGRPLMPVQIQILKDDKRAAPNQAGEIYLKGPTITPGYLNRPEATAQTLRDGWLATGDLGYVDDEGYLYVLDRRSDLIISGGENIYPAEIEAILLSHPMVEEAGVYGQQDPEWGQVPIACVHLKAGTTINPADLRDFVGKRLAHYKTPRQVYITNPLPRNASGKLLRRQLPSLIKTHDE